MLLEDVFELVGEADDLVELGEVDEGGGDGDLDGLDVGDDVGWVELLGDGDGDGE